MEPTTLQIFLLGLIQGAAELLPVSSSAHVIVAEKLMGLDPSSPPMTFLLVMLHSGTMIAVIAYFWTAWKRTFFADLPSMKRMTVQIGTASIATVLLGFGLKLLIERSVLHGAHGEGEVEQLFGNLRIIAGSLLTAGLLILAAGHTGGRNPRGDLDTRSSLWVGLAQGLTLPFRGLSRSGTTISTGLLLGVSRRRIEEFSFALAVVLTPGVVALEFKRLLKSHAETASPLHLLHLAGPGLVGMAASFVAGLLALKLLSSWLEKGHWAWFGYYCLLFSGLVFFLASLGL
jgi:undecaprenyl-diphosphatase